MMKRYQEMNKRQKLFIIATTLIVLIVLVNTFFYSTKNEIHNDKLKIAASFYPIAFFAQQIGGEKVTVNQLVPDNVEVHNWQPSFADILALEEADMIIYNGATLDQWFEDDMLTIIDSSRKTIVETTDGIQLIETEMETDEFKPKNNELNDPHTWISPFLAKQQAQKIYQTLIQKDPIHTEYYSTRWQNLKTRFEELDNKYMSQLSTKQKEKIFVAHSAFGYLANRYGFVQHGIIGISADEQPSVSTYIELVEMMIKHKTYVVFVDPVYPNGSAQTLRNELNRLTGNEVKILDLYFMLGDLDGLDYFGQLERNLENLMIGLEVQ
jgi:zinc transport system substrate-binding protein